MGGGSPANTTQNVTTQTQLPAWYSDYLQNVMGRAVGAADEPYQAYTGPRNAALTNDQLSAYKTIENNQGVANPYFGGAGDALSSASGINFQGAVQPGIDQITAAGGRDTSSAMLPYAQTGAGLVQQSTQGSALAQANPYIQQSVAPLGLGAAQPYLGAASGNTADVSSYMDPYNSAVTNRIATLGARNLSENILPGIGDQFVNAGQFGSTRQADITGRAIRDTQDSILAQQNQALQSGYTSAQAAKAADLSRYAGLASTAGGLGSAQQQTLLGAGQAAGQLSSADLARLQAAGIDISQIGTSISSAQATDAARALAAGQSVGQLGLGAAQAQSANLLGVAQGAQGLGEARQNSLIKDSAALEQAGQAQQNQTQQNYNTAYTDFQNQVNYPKDQTAFLSNVIQGLPTGGSTTSSSVGTTPQPSALGQIAGVGLGVAGLANSGLFKARGGAVKKPRRNHSYGNLPKRGIALASAA